MKDAGITQPREFGETEVSFRGFDQRLNCGLQPLDIENSYPGAPRLEIE